MTLKKNQEAYYKYTETARYGMQIPYPYVDLPEGPCLSLKLKPTKYPKSGKKLYRGMFMRSVGGFIHIYVVKENLYVAGLQAEPHEWIDSNYEKILERVTAVSQQKEFL